MREPTLSQPSLRSPAWILRWLATRPRSSQAGFTLIESLMAIVVITVLLVSITPPIFLATATRIQNRRAEQALQIAQGEIERVRTIVERNQYPDDSQFPPVTTTVKNGYPAPPPPNTAAAGLRSVSEKCSSTAPAVATSVTQYIQVNASGWDASTNSCPVEFLVQTFRTAGTQVQQTDSSGTTTTRTVGFIMGVRVYSVVAVSNLASGKADTTQSSLKMTTGQGGFRVRPISVLYSTIVQNSSSQALTNYRNLVCTEPGKC